VGATDPRVAAIAPIVFDMLNMKAQTDWAKKVYEAVSKLTLLRKLGHGDSTGEERLA
jgi:PhoPQ-activated pathogenicity-related protein